MLCRATVFGGNGVYSEDDVLSCRIKGRSMVYILGRFVTSHIHILGRCVTPHLFLKSGLESLDGACVCMSSFRCCRRGFWRIYRDGNA